MRAKYATVHRQLTTSARLWAQESETWKAPLHSGSDELGGPQTCCLMDRAESSAVAYGSVCNIPCIYFFYFLFFYYLLIFIIIIFLYG